MHSWFLIREALQQIEVVGWQKLMAAAHVQVPELLQEEQRPATGLLMALLDNLQVNI